MQAQSHVVVEGVSKVFDNAQGSRPPVLGNIFLTLGEGEFLSIVGPSGCGKSTLLRIISGLVPPTAGQVFIRGQRVEGPPPKVGFMFQRDTLMPWATVTQNIEVALQLGGVAKTEWPTRIAQLLELLGLGAYGHYLPAALSGGMRQRVALGRLLAYAPDLYLMDEPFGALDAMTKMLMGRELLRIWSKEAKSVIFITHDIEEAVGLSDRVIVMAAAPGRIHADYKINLPRPRDYRSVRLLPEFRDIVETIWNDIGFNTEQPVEA